MRQLAAVATKDRNPSLIGHPGQASGPFTGMTLIAHRQSLSQAAVGNVVGRVLWPKLLTFARNERFREEWSSGGGWWRW